MTTAQANIPEAEADEISPPSPGVGNRLREAREARGLPLQEVAAHLHLHVRTIEALEADDFDSLPSPIYVRGYIRNYAKLLQLDGDSLIAAYDDNAGRDPHLTPPLKPPPQASSSDRPVKAITYLLGLTLVLLLLAWWQSRHVDYFDEMPMLVETTPAPEPDADTPEILTIQGLDYPVSVVRHPDSPFLPGPGRAPAATADPPPPAPAEAEADIARPPAEADTTVAPVAPLLPAEAPDTVTPDEPAQGLTLELSAESWIEVYDVDGGRLYHGLGRPGETLRFDGKPPLKVVLGYAPGVRVSYGGEAFDPEPYATAGVARFQIGN